MERSSSTRCGSTQGKTIRERGALLPIVRGRATSATEAVQPTQSIPSPGVRTWLSTVFALPLLMRGSRAILPELMLQAAVLS